MLGYNSLNLLYGMTAWTYKEEIAPDRFETYEDDMVTFKDVLSYQICWTEKPEIVMSEIPPGWKPEPTAPPEDQNW
jgi:hypothetical protein